MDRSNLQESLFPRGSSTPPLGPQQPFNSPTNTSPSHHIDSLFHNLSAPSSGQQMGTAASGNMYANPPLATSNKSMGEEAISTSTSAPVNSTSDRQSALLSLLGSSVSTTGGTVRGAPGGGPPPQPQPQSQPQTQPQTQPQQVPTPPGSSQAQQRGARNSPNNVSETQGKHLLEQLMSG